MSDLPDHADLVVVGGGICGHACAASAAARGATVVLLEKEPAPAAEASGKAQGALRLQGREPAEFPLAREAMELWAAAGEEAGAEHDFELVFGGNVYICDDEREMPMLRRLVKEAHESGLTAVRLLQPTDARELMPFLKGRFAAAMYSPVDGHCQPDKATRFFAWKASRAGATLRYGVKALKLVQRGGAVRGVITDHGAVKTDAVVVAAGIWTPYLSDTVGVHVPIMPVALSEAETTATAPLFRQTLRAFGFGGRQRPDGRVVFSAGINATVGHAVTLSDLRDLRLWAPRLLGHWRDIRLGVDLRRCLQQVRCRSTHSPKLIGPAPTLAGNARALQTSLRRMKKLMPDLGEVRIGRTWAGMLDMSPDGLPILDGAAGPAGLVIVTGLSGHGFTLGPVIGEIAADLALTRATSRPIHAFRLRRFREEKVRIPEKMI